MNVRKLRCSLFKDYPVHFSSLVGITHSAGRLSKKFTLKPFSGAKIPSCSRRLQSLTISNSTSNSFSASSRECRFFCSSSRPMKHRRLPGKGWSFEAGLKFAPAEIQVTNNWPIIKTNRVASVVPDIFIVPGKAILTWSFVVTCLFSFKRCIKPTA